MMNYRHRKNIQGYFLMLAVIFIMVIGVMGSLIAYLFANRGQLSVSQRNGLNAFYIAESGLEISTRLLTMPNLSGTPTRLACSAVTGTSAITNAAMSNGTFTVTTVNSSPLFATDSLSAVVTASVTSIPVVSTAGFAPSGKLIIDQEAMDYGAISGNSFVGVTRGVSGTIASSHASGTGVGQYVCDLDVVAGIPNLTSTSYQRELQWTVQLEDGWAVGNTLSGPTRWNTTHWNYPTELQWTQVVPSISTPQHLNGVSVVSNVDAWAVGNKASTLHYNGSSWSLLNTGIPGADNVEAVYGVSANEVWVCTSSGDIYKWSGSSWTRIYNGANQLNSISMIETTGNGTADFGWAVGLKKTAVLYNGTTWVSTGTGITVDLNAVSTLSSSDAWAAGNSGKIFHWNGSGWSVVTTPSTTPTLNGLSMIQSNTVDIGWAVGNSSTAWYYNGSTWSAQTTGLAGGLTLNAVVTVSANEAIAVASGGQIYEWNGTSWTLLTTTGFALNAIDLLHLPSQPNAGWRQIYH